MNMYFSPFSTMYGVSDIICIIGPDRNIPISAKNIQLKNEILYPSAENRVFTEYFHDIDPEIRTYYEHLWEEILLADKQ